jgi:flagellar motor switch protein FliM
MTDETTSNSDANNVLSAEEVERLMCMGSEVIAETSIRGSNNAQPDGESIDILRKLSKEQMKTLQTMHEGFTRKFAVRLSLMLRTKVEVCLRSVDQLAYPEFMFELDNPTCFNLVRVEPLDVTMLLNMNPATIYPMIDRMFGEDDWECSAPLRSQRPKVPLNEGELLIAWRVSDEFFEELKPAWKHAWKNVSELNFSVVQYESNVQLSQVVTAPNTEVVVLCFEVKFMGVLGNINLCIPYDFFERIQRKSFDDMSIESLFERAEQKLKEVSQLLSEIRRISKDKTSGAI